MFEEGFIHAAWRGGGESCAQGLHAREASGSMVPCQGFFPMSRLGEDNCETPFSTSSTTYVKRYEKTIFKAKVERMIHARKSMIINSP